MCVTPNELDDGTIVGCRKCWRCTKNKINDYVGRCIAEQLQSVATFAVTLTYVGDTPNIATLVYDDFQKFMKRLRKAGYKVRYIVAGEYGKKNGRAHWHACLFFQDNGKKKKYPTVRTEPYTNKGDDIFLARWDKDPAARIQWSPWSNKSEGRGHAYFQEADHNGFEYIMKYALKDLHGTGSVTHKGQSTVPLLGWQYFMDMADQYVEQGLDPQSFTYSFPDVFDKRNRRRKYMLQGAAREQFIDRFIEGYEQKHGRPYPHTDIEILAKVLDKRALDEMNAQMTDVEWVQRKEYEAREKALNRLRVPDPEERAEEIKQEKEKRAYERQALEKQAKDAEYRRQVLVVTGQWREYPAQFIQTPQDEFIVTIGAQTWREESSAVRESLCKELKGWSEETLQDVWYRDEFEQQYQDECRRLAQDGPMQKRRGWGAQSQS